MTRFCHHVETKLELISDIILRLDDMMNLVDVKSILIVDE